MTLDTLIWTNKWAIWISTKTFLCTNWISHLIVKCINQWTCRNNNSMLLRSTSTKIHNSWIICSLKYQCLTYNCTYSHSRMFRYQISLILLVICLKMKKTLMIIISSRKCKWVIGFISHLFLIMWSMNWTIYKNCLKAVKKCIKWCCQVDMVNIQILIFQPK